mmetsp:Transcript_10474/g.21092  ORF Transcript_10474/g.21092 Transcript_10474/m.21092 type:complete len:162 (-) Transcript_10474:41-526(-)
MPTDGPLNSPPYRKTNHGTPMCAILDDEAVADFYGADDVPPRRGSIRMVSEIPRFPVVGGHTHPRPSAMSPSTVCSGLDPTMLVTHRWVTRGDQLVRGALPQDSHHRSCLLRLWTFQFHFFLRYSICPSHSYYGPPFLYSLPSISFPLGVFVPSPPDITAF